MCLYYIQIIYKVVTVQLNQKNGESIMQRYGKALSLYVHTIKFMYVTHSVSSLGYTFLYIY